MEAERFTCDKLFTRISLMSYIMPYYGYANESAQLFRGLCQKSRREWDDNISGITDVIMAGDSQKLKIDFGNKFTWKSLKILLTNNNYNYFRVKVTLVRQ